jgi:hypothetical protein
MVEELLFEAFALKLSAHGSVALLMAVPIGVVLLALACASPEGDA